MREIKFRGKRISDGMWVYGDFTSDDKIHIQPPYYDEDGSVEWWGYSVIPETVGQFTGLTDKNGKEIFEGDIVTTGRLQYFIKYEDGAFYAYHCKIKDVYLTPYRWGRLARFEELNREIEVMDNIHDNPELLKTRQ